MSFSRSERSLIKSSVDATLCLVDIDVKVILTAILSPLGTSSMVNINPIRRAEIGREKRARTRAQLVAAAKSLFARSAVEAVTVDEVVKEAGVAKGTFYFHFEDLQALTAAVADDLIESIEPCCNPAGSPSAIRHIVLRLAAAPSSTKPLAIRAGQRCGTYGSRISKGAENTDAIFWKI